MVPFIYLSDAQEAASSVAKGTKAKGDVGNLVSELHNMRYEHSVIADRFLDMER